MCIGSRAKKSRLLATAGCYALGLFVQLDGDVEIYRLLGLSSLIMKGYDSGQVGRNDGHAGVIHERSRVAGA